MLARRSFLTGLVSLIASPAIVRASSLMPVKSMAVVDVVYRDPILDEGLINPDTIAADLCSVTTRAFVPKLFVQIYQDYPLLAQLQARADAHQKILRVRYNSAPYQSIRAISNVPSLCHIPTNEPS